MLNRISYFSRKNLKTHFKLETQPVVTEYRQRYRTFEPFLNNYIFLVLLREFSEDCFTMKN